MINQPVKRGFTLVETLVAITVLIVAIVGPLYAVHRSLIASYTARDSLIATALAQEGLEYVRSVRDGNYLSNNSNWMGGLSLCISGSGCTVDPHGPSIQSCTSSGCPALRIDGSYRYRQTTGTTSRFSRRVTITTISATEVQVSVQVSWETSRIPYTLTVTERLHNWQ